MPNAPVNSTMSGNQTNRKKKLTGPYVHVAKAKGGSKLTYTIVNATKKLDDDKDGAKRGSSACNRNLSVGGQNHYGVGNHLPKNSLNMSATKKHSVSTDSESILKDSSWICIFCQQRPHYKAMGDLFGPYYIPVENNSAVNNQVNQREVWFHEDCLVWSNGVYLVGHRIRNIEEVIKDCYENVCCECKFKGASLGCLHKGCSPRYHFLCAKEKGCDMNEENFSIHCPKHRSFPSSSLNAR